jgi:hypothetical protein
LTNNKQTKIIPNFYYEREKSKSTKDLLNTTIQIRKKYLSKERPKSFHEDYKEYEQFNQYFNLKNNSNNNSQKYSKGTDDTKRYSTIRANNQRSQCSNTEKSKKDNNKNQFQNQQILLKQPFSNLPIIHSDFKTSQNNRQLMNECQLMNQQFSNYYPHQISYRMAYPSDATQFYNFGFIPSALRLPGIHQNQIFYPPPGLQVQNIEPIKPRQSKAIPIINPQVKTTF